MYSRETDTIYHQVPERFVTHPYSHQRPNISKYKRGHITPSLPDTLGKFLQPVDIKIDRQDITIIGYSNNNSHGTKNNEHLLHDLAAKYHNLPTSIQCLCSAIHIPPDGGKALINYAVTNNKPLFGASDASLKESQCSHAWVLTTDEISHL